jgi:hypothetical protein
MTRIFAVARIVLCGVATLMSLTGCSYGFLWEWPHGYVSKSDVEQQIRDQAGMQVPDLTSVRCPADLPAKVGESLRCESLVNGAPVGIVATVTSVEGDAVRFDIDSDPLPDPAQPHSAPATWADVTDAPSGVAFKLPAASAPNVMSHGRGHKADADVSTVVSLSVYDSLAVSPDESIALQTPEGMTVAERSDTTVQGRPAVDARLTGSTEGSPSVLLLRTIRTDSRTVSLVTGGAVADERTVERMHQYLVDSVRIP